MFSNIQGGRGFVMDIRPQINNNINKNNTELNKKNKLFKCPKIRIGFFISLMCVGFVLSFFSGMKINKARTIDTSTIADKIDKVSELSSLKYNYSSVVTLKDSMKIKNFSIPFTGKSFIIKYNGYIKFGTNLKKKTITISPDRKKVNISLENCKVLDNVADTKNLLVYDESYSVFNRYGAQDMIDEIGKEQKKVEKELIEEGYIEKANNEVKTLLKGILQDMGFEGISINFK